jgi:hypothetical protein
VIALVLLFTFVRPLFNYGGFDCNELSWWMWVTSGCIYFA